MNTPDHARPLALVTGASAGIINVASLPGYMCMSAEDVVAISLDRFGEPNAPVMLVPGRWNRFLAALSRKLPYRAAFNMVRRRSRKFRGRE